MSFQEHTPRLGVEIKTSHLSTPGSILCSGGQGQSVWYGSSPLPGVGISNRNSYRASQTLPTETCSGTNYSAIRCLLRWQKFSRARPTLSLAQPGHSSINTKWSPNNYALKGWPLVELQLALVTSPWHSEGPSTKQSLFTAEDCGVLCSFVPSNCST